MLYSVCVLPTPGIVWSTLLRGSKLALERKVGHCYLTKQRGETWVTVWGKLRKINLQWKQPHQKKRIPSRVLQNKTKQNLPKGQWRVDLSNYFLRLFSTSLTVKYRNSILQLIDSYLRHKLEIIFRTKMIAITIAFHHDFGKLTSLRPTRNLNQRKCCN